VEGWRMTRWRFEVGDLRGVKFEEMEDKADGGLV
jgi:hypothetical protein